ncbi:N-acetylmuramoyl-L-alanine amidase-like domain-containing protein [Bacteroides sp. UBA939]|uniref:N-acetylmuramoyl-L-alanine amidase-like domain-containing protein n=1 Tax=Bacteroides sp. UBA939 TaxID=1946092 RepID=UPI0025C27463|nr:N-acetylmuramoyl-L-alanine amidase-like domain-containing protein [Bacteroides sp. UBA939]
MKTMTTLLLSALCVATVNAQTEDKSNVMLNNGISFLNIPYVAHTLEVNDGTEELIINCDEVDCTTFVEYALAMSLSSTEDGQVAEGEFADNLQKIRYRDGKINGYISRLHYNTDWANNGIRQGFLEDVAATYSPYTRRVSLSYMSSHPEQYKHLSNSPENVAKIKEIESSLSGQEFHFVPEELVKFNGLPWIKNGDIIAITTNTPGLDVTHMGIAFYVDDKLCLLHASSKDKKVVVSKVALGQMLKSNDNWTGIRVLRMKK